eukprot:6249297-Prymnesium_polylepis.1
MHSSSGSSTSRSGQDRGLRRGVGSPSLGLLPVEDPDRLGYSPSKTPIEKSKIPTSSAFLHP